MRLGHDGATRAPAPVASVPSVPAPSNFFTAPIEKLHRAAHPEPSFEDGYRFPFWQPERTPDAKPAEPESAKPAEQTETPDAATETQVDPASLPPVIEAPAAKVTADEQAGKLLSPILNRLDGLACNSELEQRRFDLLIRIEEVRKSLATFFSDQREWLVSDLQRQQEEASEKCRQQKAVIASLEPGKAEAESAVRKASGQVSSCRTLLNRCDEEKPSDDRWPTRLEKAQWQAERDHLAAALEQAQTVEEQARADLRTVVARILGEQRKFNELADAELILRERLSGQPWFDHEVGLQRQPEV
jgi:hypothetical protein